MKREKKAQSKTKTKEKIKIGRKKEKKIENQRPNRIKTFTSFVIY